MTTDLRSADGRGEESGCRASKDGCGESGTHLDVERQVRKVVQGCEIYLGKIMTDAKCWPF